MRHRAFISISLSKSTLVALFAEAGKRRSLAYLIANTFNGVEPRAMSLASQAATRYTVADVDVFTHVRSFRDSMIASISRRGDPVALHMHKPRGVWPSRIEIMTGRSYWDITIRRARIAFCKLYLRDCIRHSRTFRSRISIGVRSHERDRRRYVACDSAISSESTRVTTYGQS